VWRPNITQGRLAGQSVEAAHAFSASLRRGWNRSTPRAMGVAVSQEEQAMIVCSCVAVGGSDVKATRTRAVEPPRPPSFLARRMAWCKNKPCHRTECGPSTGGTAPQWTVTDCCHAACQACRRASCSSSSCRPCRSLPLSATTPSLSAASSPCSSAVCMAVTALWDCG
jgi:hypothetical protein